MYIVPINIKILGPLLFNVEDGYQLGSPSHTLSMWWTWSNSNENETEERISLGQNWLKDWKLNLAGCLVHWKWLITKNAPWEIHTSVETGDKHFHGIYGLYRIYKQHFNGSFKITPQFEPSKVDSQVTILKSELIIAAMFWYSKGFQTFTIFELYKFTPSW